MVHISLLTTGMIWEKTRSSSRAVRVEVVEWWFGLDSRLKINLRFASLSRRWTLMHTKAFSTSTWCHILSAVMSCCKITHNLTSHQLQNSGSAITLIPLPARSLDLNPVENVWALLVRDVYRGDRRYYSMNELKDAILASWSGVTQDALNGLARSMPDRLFHCIAAKGGYTKYWLICGLTCCSLFLIFNRFCCNACVPILLHQSKSVFRWFKRNLISMMGKCECNVVLQQVSGRCRHQTPTSACRSRMTINITTVSNLCTAVYIYLCI